MIKNYLFSYNWERRFKYNKEEFIVSNFNIDVNRVIKSITIKSWKVSKRVVIIILRSIYAFYLVKLSSLNEIENTWLKIDEKLDIVVNNFNINESWVIIIRSKITKNKIR